MLLSRLFLLDVMGNNSKTDNLFVQKDGSSDKSPLQLLAQTCSQIGADTGPGRSAAQGGKEGGRVEKEAGTREKGGNQGKVGKPESPPIIVTDSGGGARDSKPVPFKPYEIPTKESKEKERARSKESAAATPTASTPSPAPRSQADPPTPIMSTGLEILAGHPKDLPLGTQYRDPLLAASAHHPAFRPAGHPSCPPVCRDPYCKDPSCPTALYNSYLRLAAGSRLPPGYLELAGLAAATPPGHAPAPALPPTSLAGVQVRVNTAKANRLLIVCAAGRAVHL